MDHSPESFRYRFWLTFLLTIPVLIYSESIQAWFNFQPPEFWGSQWLPFLLSTLIVAYGGIVFLRGARAEVRAKKPGMMTLISLAITVAYGYSVAVTFGFPGETLYWELATLVAIMLLGHWFEMSAVVKAQGSLKALAALLPDKALRIKAQAMEEVLVSELAMEDLILVRPGDRMPADGVIEKGQSMINESLITGESAPVNKAPGDSVIAGSINGGGSLRVRVKGIGEETALAGIMRMVQAAQASKSPVQVLADRAAFWLVAVALGVAVLTFTAWLISGAPLPFVIERVVTVLVAACPHALGLAIPLVVAIITSIAATNGLLIKDRLALEEARRLDCIVFDKTGTLTHGDQHVVAVHPAHGFEKREILRLAAAAEMDSEHFIGKSIVSFAQKMKIDIPAAEQFETESGRGVQAQVDGRAVQVGGPHLLTEMGLEPEDATFVSTQDGGGLYYVWLEGKLIGAIETKDRVRDASRKAVELLKKRGIEVIMLTGDSENVAQQVAVELGLDRYFSEVLPQDKAEVIERLQTEGYRVGMVGDGINDAPALAASDVGIAIGAGTDVAVETAGIVLIKNDPLDVVRLLNLSRATYRKMVQNLAWAAGYNVVILPLAAGLLTPFGFLLPMAVAAILMSGSTIMVAVNAQLLRRLDLTQT